MERTFKEQSDQGNKRYMGMQESDTGQVGSKTSSGGMTVLSYRHWPLLKALVCWLATEIKEAERLASSVKSWG